MSGAKMIACVTGGRGLVGRWIVQHLLAEGYAVRALSRRRESFAAQIDMFYGSLSNTAVLDEFLSGAHLLFHCAAELNSEDLMWDVNVEGTRNLVRAAEKAGIGYFCHLSSVGVIGRTDQAWVDESCECNPQNLYEQSKWEAEKIVAQGINGCHVVILRPTNVFDEENLGILRLLIHGGSKVRLKVLLQGNECTHLIHAQDVAAAALHFVAHPFEKPECFFVSCDDEPLNCFAGVWAICEAIRNDGKESGEFHVPWSAPVWVPHLIRTILRGKGNRGDVRYSAKKLLSTTGFKFPLGFRESLQRVMLSAENKA